MQGPSMPPSEKHEQALKETVEELEAQGYRILLMGRLHPDAIAEKDGEIVAVEVLGKYKRKRSPDGRSRGYKLTGGLTFEEKRRRYSRFDNIHFTVFYYEKDDNRIDRFWDKRTTNISPFLLP